MHQECAPINDVTLLSSKLHTLHNDVADIKGSIKELTSAINKLALVEERISNAVAAQERTFKIIEKIEERLDALERSQVTADNTNKWVERGIVAGLAAVITFIWERVRNG